MSTATRSTKGAMGRHAGSTHRHDSSRLFTAPSRAFGFGIQLALARGALVGLWVFGGVDEMHANIKTSLLRLLSSVFLLTSLGEVFAENLAPAPYLDWGRQGSPHAPADSTEGDPAFYRSKRSSVVLFSQHIGSHGRDFFAAVCAQDLEGIVAKRKDGSYDPTKTQWLKIKNRDYSQARDRHELFQQ